MCSVEEGSSEPTPLKSGDSASQTCMKCSQRAVVCVRLNDPLCESCFLAYFTHKFRATLGKSRLVRHGEKVLLAFSGGPSSSAMLHLVTEGFSDRVPRKLRFQPGVVFIDECALFPDMNGSEIGKKIQGIVSGGGFPFHSARLEDVFGSKDAKSAREMDSEMNDDGNNDAETQLKVLFQSICTLTAKEDLLRSLQGRVLLEVARREGYSKVMLGDSATRLAVRLLSNISQGRGAAVPYDTGFGDDRHGDVVFIRPMREFMAKEVGLYNFFRKIEAVRIPTLSTLAHSHASIDHLTEGFVSGLQARFPFTVSTIFRTGDKLLAQKVDKDASHCSVCGVPIQARKVVSQDAAESSKPMELLSVGLNDLTVSANLVHTGCSQEGAFEPLDKFPWGNIAKTLCYGCHLTLKDANCSVDCLPSFVMEGLNNAKMKEEEIRDFLLED